MLDGTLMLLLIVESTAIEPPSLLIECIKTAKIQVKSVFLIINQLFLYFETILSDIH